MNVAITAAKGAYNQAMHKALEKALPQVKLLPWSSGEKAPAETVDVLLAMGPVKREDMEALPGLQLVQTLSDGYETVDVDAATELGIYVSYAPAEATGNGDSVAEFAVLLLLAAARRLGIALAATRDTGVQKPGNAQTLLGKTVCIVGMGSIGTLIADRLVAFGVRVIGVDRLPLMAPKGIPTRPVEQIDEALAESDFVVLAIRADEKTKHMFNADRFSAMKPGAIVVNVARGSLVDEAALLHAVKSGHLGGAGLDVLEQEPVDPQNPLLSVPQIFVTPHQAGLTDLTIEGTAQYMAYVLQQFDAGKAVKSVLNKPEKPRKALKAD